MSSRKLFSMFIVLMIVAALVLSSCSSPAPTATPEPPPTAAPTTATGGEQPTSAPATTGGIDWKQFEGTELSIILNKHPAAEAMIGQLPDFTAKTGITVKYEILAEAEYFSKLPLELASGTGLYDVFMTGPSEEWNYVPGNWIENLRPYMDDETLTDKAWWNEGDFFPSLLAANRWNGLLGGGVGEGPQYGIPIMVETYVLAYRGDLADKYNLEEPTTIQEYYEFAKAMQEGERAAGNADFYGAVGRGHPNAMTCCGYHSSKMGYMAPNGFQAVDFDTSSGEFKSLLNHPGNVEAISWYIKTMKDYSAPGWNVVDWFDAKELFSTGKYGMFADCDFFAYSYEDASKSPAAGKTRYTGCLRPEGEEAQTGMWTWALGMATASKNKGAAWYFIEYMTGPEQLAKGTIEYNNYNPTRRSVFEHPDVQAVMKSWGQGTYLPIVLHNLEVARLGNTPHPQGREVSEAEVRAAHAIWGGADAQAELDKAAEEINNIMKSNGLVPGTKLAQ